MSTLSALPLSAATPPDGDYVWDRRYGNEGHIWGDEPSMVGEKIVSLIGARAHVLEFGYGYGRDLQEVLLHGHSVYGIEKSHVAHSEANKLLKPYVDSGQAQLLLIGDFTKASVPDNHFDAFIAHRVPHLLGKNGLVRAFNSLATRTLKPGGYLVISARNPKDFNDQQMDWVIPDDTAQYKDTPEFKDRSGQVIRFWNKKMFQDAYSANFDIIDFVDGKEIESVKNPVDTNFTMMIARKKFPQPANSP